MPNSEADGDQATPILIPSETEDQLAAPDPLLGSGSFIDPSNGGGGDRNASKEAENSPNPSSALLKRARPSWLPENWEMQLRQRTSGATEGTVDRVGDLFFKYDAMFCMLCCLGFGDLYVLLLLVTMHTWFKISLMKAVFE